MPPRRSKNFTRITTTNIIDVSKPGRRTRSPRPADTNAPSRAQVSTSNIIDAPNAPRQTRRGTIPASLTVRTPSTRHETRHDPLTRKDRAARLQPTKGGRFAKTKSKTKPKSKAKATKTQQRDLQNGEGTQDDEDPLSLMDDNPSKQASDTKTLGESDGNRNATRTTAYEGPTSQEMLKALDESIADAATDTGTDGPAQHGEEMESRNADDNTTTASTRPPHRASTPVSDTDADDNHDDNNNDNNEPSTPQGRRSQMTTSRPTPSPEPTAPPISSPPESEQILTYPNGPDMPPLITYKNSTPPPPRRRGSPSQARLPLPSEDPFFQIRPAPLTVTTKPRPRPRIPAPPGLGVEALLQSPFRPPRRRRRRSPSPTGIPPTSKNQDPIVRNIPPAPSSSHTTNPLPHLPHLPLPPTPARPGLRVESPSRSQSPPSSPAEKWNHQPAGYGSLVPREGGYRSGRIERWPYLPERMVERMRKGGWEVRGEEIVGVERVGEGEEGEKGEGSGDGDGDGNGDGGADDVGEGEGAEGVGDSEKGSEVSEVGDPADTTTLELEGLFEGY
ncbi:MAG: hypothetical protein L6R36_007337 [Xanthoria steineri]|nr:MAG: hypothetical protein L6R36_007337 [Xanthoria steineri]